MADLSTFLHMRIAPDLAQRLDEYCASREYPTTRTAVVEKLLRDLLAKEAQKHEKSPEIRHYR